MTDYDVKGRQVRYVVFRPSVAVTRIEIMVRPAGAGRSRAIVTYRRTALGPAGEPAVKELVDTWDARAAAWTRAINAALARERQPPR
jgi:hypothetical protein